MGRRAAVPLPPLFVVVVGLFAVWTWACAIVPPAPAQAAAAAPAAAQALHRLRQELDVLGKELDSEASASAEPAPPVYAAPAVAAPSCAYLPDVDYDDGDAAGVMLEHSDRERCCAACAAHAWCKAAVLSAAFDEPPNACWLKRATHTPKAKPGVVACIPDAAAAHAAQVAIAANAAAADCDFRPDVDFSPSALDPDEPALLDADEWSCCAECSADPSCAAAVLSGPQDTPRFACWIKREAKGEIYKQGVISCRPANRGAAAEPGVAPPAAPPVAPAAAAAPSSKYELRAAPGIEVPSAAELEQRRAAIRGAVAHAWKGPRRRRRETRHHDSTEF